jgi:hypothetical protein
MYLKKYLIQLVGMKDIRSLKNCTLTKVFFMNTYILKIISYIKKLNQLNFFINYKLNIDLFPMQFIVKRKRKKR